MAAALLAAEIARYNRIRAGVKLAFGPLFQGSDLADFSRPNAIRWLRALIGNSTSAAARSDGYRGTWHSPAVLANIRTMLLTVGSRVNNRPLLIDVVQTPAAARHLAWLDPVRAALASGDGFPRPLRTFEVGTRVTFLEEGATRSGHSGVVSVVPADGDDGGFYFITFDDNVIQRTTEDHLADGQPVGGQQLPPSAGTLPAAVPPSTSAAVQAVIAGHAAVGGPLNQALANGGVPSAAANTLFERNAEVGHPAAGIGAPTLMGVHHGGLDGLA